MLKYEMLLKALPFFLSSIWILQRNLVGGYKEKERSEVTSKKQYAFGLELVKEGKTRLKMADLQGSSKDGGN